MVNKFLFSIVFFSSLALSPLPAFAAISGHIENLEEAYLLYQAKDACPLEVSEYGIRIIVQSIQTFEKSGTEASNKALWEKVAGEMPMAKMIGVCPLFWQEILLIEQLRSPDSPEEVPDKPNF